MSVGKVKKRSISNKLSGVSQHLSERALGTRKTIFTKLGKKKKLILAMCFLGLLVFGLDFGSKQFNSYFINAQVASNSESFQVESPNIEAGSVAGVSVEKIEFTPRSAANLLDKRAWVLDEFFKSWNSPLYGYGRNFVEACDKYGSPKDCVMVAAIAANESHLCTYYMSWEMKNCWGYGGGQEHRWTFNSIEEAIDTVTMLITTKYGVEFMNDPSLYELTFCGVAEPECWGWGNSVKFFMRQIRSFALARGVDMAN